MMTVPPAIHQVISRPEFISKLTDRPTPTNIAANSLFVTAVINGQVVTTPRTSVHLDENGMMTIPLLDEFA